MGEGLFVLTLALLFTHELDAIARHEWRMFPGTNRLPDGQGFAVFLLAHVPIFWLVLRYCFEPTGTGAVARIVVAVFSIVHIGLHLIYRRHPANEFDNALSQVLIWGAGLAGALYLAAQYAVSGQA